MTHKRKPGVDRLSGARGLRPLRHSPERRRPWASLDARRDDESYASDKPRGLPLIHYLNTDGLRAQVVSVKAVSTTRLTLTASRYRQGDRAVFTATVAPSVATGSVSFTDNGNVVKTVAVTGGEVTWHATGQRRGRNDISAIYLGDVANASSRSPPASVTVTGLFSRPRCLPATGAILTDSGRC